MPEWMLVGEIPGVGWVLAAFGVLAIPAVRKHWQPVVEDAASAGLAIIRQFAESQENAEDLREEPQAGTTAAAGKSRSGKAVVEPAGR